MQTLSKSGSSQNGSSVEAYIRFSGCFDTFSGMSLGRLPSVPTSGARTVACSSSTIRGCGPYGGLGWRKASHPCLWHRSNLARKLELQTLEAS